MERERGHREHSGAASRRGPPTPARSVDLDRKIAELTRANGLPQPLARQVAMGQIDLNEAVKRLAFQDEVNALIQRHGFNRALATQIALGQVDRDQMLARRRVEEHLAGQRDRSILEEYRGLGTELTVGAAGRKVLRSLVKGVEKYEVILEDLDSHQSQIWHKLQLKYAYRPADSKMVRKAMTWDKARKEKTVEVQVRPQDRYACSDRRLGLAMDSKAEVQVTLLEGEVFTGHVAWVARYEFGLRVRQGAEVVIFRHSLDLLSGD